MIIGVIAEGHSDRAVITNILTGLTGLGRNDIWAIRPEYSKDETDKAKDPKTFSTWSVVKEECEKREQIDAFLALEDQEFVVIHLDTAEADQYGIHRPDKRQPDYGEQLRILVINKINEWLKGNISGSILYAVAIEEMEAWLLPIYEKNKNSIKSAKPKEKFIRRLGQLGIDSTPDYKNYFILSEPLSKKKSIGKDGLLNHNISLKAFYAEVQAKVLPKLKI
jgi:hypothetical protein